MIGKFARVVTTKRNLDTATPSTATNMLMVSTNETAIGGVTRFCITLAHALREYEWNARVIFPSSIDRLQVAAWAAPNGVEVEFADWAPTDLGKRSVRQTIALWRNIRASRCNAVSIHYGGSDLSMKDALAIRLAGVRTCVAHLHAPSANRLTNRKRIMTRLSSWLYTKVLPVSEEIEAVLLSAGVPQNRIDVVHGGVPAHVPSISPEFARQILGIPQSAVVIGCVARFSEEKGIGDLMRAVSGLQGADVHLVLQGEGPLRDQLVSLSESILRDEVTFVPSTSDPALVYRASDVFALASYREGVPLVLMEAAMHGIPLVTTDVGGAATLVTDGDNGRLTRPGDIAQMTEVLQLLIDEPSSRLRLGGNACSRAVGEFSDAVMAARTHRALTRTKV